MQSGADIDIVTGRPLEQTVSDKEAEKQIREENILKKKAEFLGLTGSIEGRHLITIVQSHLAARIDTLVANDPPAQTLIKILADLGIKENEANKAAARLTAMRIRKE